MHKAGIFQELWLTILEAYSNLYHSLNQNNRGKLGNSIFLSI